MLREDLLGDESDGLSLLSDGLVRKSVDQLFCQFESGSAGCSGVLVGLSEFVGFRHALVHLGHVTAESLVGVEGLVAELTGVSLGHACHFEDSGWSDDAKWVGSGRSGFCSRDIKHLSGSGRLAETGCVVSGRRIVLKDCQDTWMGGSRQDIFAGRLDFILTHHILERKSLRLVASCVRGLKNKFFETIGGQIP